MFKSSSAIAILTSLIPASLFLINLAPLAQSKNLFEVPNSNKVSPSTLSQASINPANYPPNGVYGAQGSLYRGSWREILSRNNRLCIKVVQGVATPYTGQEVITISSVSLKSGKLYVDSDGQEFELRELEGKNDKPKFGHAIRGYWEFEGKTVNKLNPEKDKNLIECVTSQGVYKKTMKGVFFK